MSPIEIPNDDIHRFIPKGPDDLRSPCPAMNALANHGYIPRDGRNLNFFQLVKVQVDVYNVSIPLAASLALEAVLLCGNGIHVDLEQLRRHNAIEHDASLVHQDNYSGNNWSIDPSLVQQMIDEASSPDGLTFKDMARVRLNREDALPYKPQQLDWAHNRIALGEASLVIGVWGLGGGEDPATRVVPIDYIRAFLLDERLPDGFQRPKHTVGFLQTLNMGGRMREEMDRLLADRADGKKSQ